MATAQQQSSYDLLQLVIVLERCCGHVDLDDKQFHRIQHVASSVDFVTTSMIKAVSCCLGYDLSDKSNAAALIWSRRGIAKGIARCSLGVRVTIESTAVLW